MNFMHFEEETHEIYHFSNETLQKVQSINV